MQKRPKSAPDPPATHAHNLNYNTNESAFTRQKWKKQNGNIVSPKWRDHIGHRAKSSAGVRSSVGTSFWFVVHSHQALNTTRRHAAHRPPQGEGGTLKAVATAAKAKCSRPTAGDPLTFSQSVLEVGVTPSLAVEVNAVPDEKGPAHTSGDSAIPAHHLFWTAQQQYGNVPVGLET